MTHEEYLDKALLDKLLVKFLKKHKCLTKYKYNTLHSSILWKYDTFNAIANAFMWRETDEGIDYWERLDTLWEDSLRVICKLNKKG